MICILLNGNPILLRQCYNILIELNNSCACHELYFECIRNVLSLDTCGIIEMICGNCK